MTKINLIKKHYTENYDEDIRFQKDLMHKAEFILTFETIKKYLKPEMKILELGAGTGNYSIELAKKGYDMTSVELVEHNLNILKSKIKPKMKIKPMLGNATNLLMLNDKQFDMVLSLGPMYHLSKNERIKSLKESIRVSKKGAMLIFAFVSNYLCVADYFKNNLNALLHDKIINKKNFHFIDNVFSLVNVEEIEKLFENVKLQKIEILSPDGISRLLRNEINNFNKKEFELWLDYLRKTSNEYSLVGYGEHILYVAKK